MIDQFSTSVLFFCGGLATAILLVPRQVAPLSARFALFVAFVFSAGVISKIIPALAFSGPDLDSTIVDHLPIAPLLTDAVKGFLFGFTASLPVLGYILFARWFAVLAVPKGHRRSIESVIILVALVALFETEYPFQLFRAVQYQPNQAVFGTFLAALNSAFAAASTLLLPFALMTICYALVSFVFVRMTGGILSAGIHEALMSVSLVWMLLLTSMFFTSHASQTVVVNPSVSAPQSRKESADV